MSEHSIIESISSLATIPRPLDPEHGKIGLASVSTFTKSKKRKVAEIAACVDGEAINIYNVSNCHSQC
jgi:hypothetical protein